MAHPNIRKLKRANVLWTTVEQTLEVLEDEGSQLSLDVDEWRGRGGTDAAYLRKIGAKISRALNGKLNRLAIHNDFLPNDGWLAI